MTKHQYTQDSLALRINAPVRKFISLKTKTHTSPLTEYPHYPEVPVPSEKVDCVYLVQMGPYFKLGYTNMPRDRVSGIAGYLPVHPIPILIIKVAYAEPLEYTLHRKFADKRCKGEWFCLSPADVSYCFRLAAALPQFYPGEWFEGQMHKQDRRCKIAALCDELVPPRK